MENSINLENYNDFQKEGQDVFSANDLKNHNKVEFTFINSIDDKPIDKSIHRFFSQPSIFNMNGIVKILNVQPPVESNVFKKIDPNFKIDQYLAVVLTNYMNGPVMRKIEFKLERTFINYSPTIKSKLIFGVAAIMKKLHEKRILHMGLPYGVYFDSNFEPIIKLSTNSYILPNDVTSINFDPFSGFNLETFVPDMNESALSFPADIYLFGNFIYLLFSDKLIINIGKNRASIHYFEYLSRGKRPERPEKISDDYWNLIEQCWKENPNERPTFDQITQILRDDKFAIEESGVKTNLNQLHEYQDRIDKRPNSHTKSDDQKMSEKVHLFDKIYSSFSIPKNENIFIDEEDEKSYELIETINEGSTSLTYKVLDTKKNLFMCKKVLKYKGDQSEIKDAQNALKEFQILHEIDHPNICKAIGMNMSEIIEIFKNGKKEKVTTIALFLEYNQYRLDEILKMENINNTMKTKIVIEIVHAMNYIHKRGLIHRDIKIENIMLNSIFETKIVDFGLVKINEYVNDQYSFVNESMTKGVGTLAYMSPEMLNEEEYDNKTDVFSFGVVLYFIFTGSLPKQGMKDKLIGKKIKLPPPSASISQSCIELLEKCLEPSPKDRPSFEAILDEMRKISFRLAPDVDSFILSQRDKQLDAIESLH